MAKDAQFYQDLQYQNKWKPVLDRKAYNPEVTSELAVQLQGKGHLNILDCCAGTGQDIIRMVEEELIYDATISAFDIREELVEEMQSTLENYGNKSGLTVISEFGPSPEFNFRLQGFNRDITVHGFVENLYDLSGDEEFDLIMGQAAVEHTNQDLSLPLIVSKLKPRGLLYLPLNYDSWFNFSPSENPELDTRVLALFNDLLDNQMFEGLDGKPLRCGDAYCGRNLPHRFKQHGLEVLAYGASDWVITPFQQSEEEISFMTYVLEGLDQTFSEEGGMADILRRRNGLSRLAINNWYQEKKRHLQDRSIGFTAVQKDILGRKRI